MQNLKFMTPKDIERLAAANARKARAVNWRGELVEPAGVLKQLKEMPQKERDRQLHAAIDFGDYDLVVLALDAKADPNSRVDGWSDLDRNWSALDNAEFYRKNRPEEEQPGYDRIIKLLIERGAKNSLQDDKPSDTSSF